MLRWTRDDKKNIAVAQSQIVYEEDWLGNETNTIDGYRCKKCHRVFDLDILEVDHIVPRAKGGTDRPSNLQLLCPPCNKKKSSTITAKAISLLKRASKPVKRVTKPVIKKATPKKRVTKPTTNKASTAKRPPIKRTTARAATKTRAQNTTARKTTRRSARR